MVCGKDQRSLAQKMSKRSELENDWTCWKCSFLDFQICQKDRCAATIEYHRPWGCHSCQSIPVLSKGTESVSYSCLGQIDERWRWTKENKVLKSNDQRRTEKCQMLRQRDNCWGQRRVGMTWRYYFGTMPQNSHSTNKRSRILVALNLRILIHSMRSSIKHSLAQPLQKCSQLCIHNSIHTLSLESYGSSCLHTPIDSTHSSSKGRRRIAAEQSSVRWWIFSRGCTPPEKDSVPGNLALPCNTRNPSLQGFRILNCCQNCRSHFYGWFWSYLVFLYNFFA